MPSITRVLSPLIFFACVFCCHADLANGQTFLVRIDATDDGTKSTKRVLETLKQAALFRYQGEAKTYQSILDLDEATSKKLSFAAKGAALKHHRQQAEVIIKNLRRYQQQAGIKVALDDLNLDDDHPKDEDGNDQGPLAGNRAFSFGMSMPPIGSIDNQPIWKNAIRKLSREQRKRYQQEMAKRDRKLQQALVEGFLVSVRLKILATESQIEKLKPILDREIGPSLLHGAKNFTFKNRGLVRFDQAVAVPEYAKPIFEVLDEQQQREWTRTIEPELTPLYNMWKSSRQAKQARAVRELGPPGVPAARLLPAMQINPAKKPKEKKAKGTDNDAPAKNSTDDPDDDQG